ncbi:MAG: J domain-containing protein [Candidatus Limnocylindria bacterium]
MPRSAVRDPYAVLGVPRQATSSQVAAAHRRLAKSHHPDLHDGGADAAVRMREINEAWEVLSSVARRAAWDLEHPWSGTASGGSHWSGGRHQVAASAAVQAQVSTRWRTAAGDPRSARKGTVRVRPRPPREEAAPKGFLETPWAAVIAGGVGLLILTAAIVAGRLIGA